jgi:polar amino acid transport system substrate-binding protein
MAVTLAVINVPSGAADDILTIAYNIKPPLFYSVGGQARGLLVERAQLLCGRSGVTCVFEELPFNRIMAHLQSNRHNFAALGFSKTSDREAFAVFSDPIYQDQKPVLVVRQSDAAKFKLYATLRDMLNSQQFVFGAKMGNVYPIDEAISFHRSRRENTPQDTPGLLKMLVFKRFDYLMFYAEELDWFKQDFTKLELEVIQYPDMPSGSNRYFLFSKMTPQTLISKMNAAIKVESLP